MAMGHQLALTLGLITGVMEIFLHRAWSSAVPAALLPLQMAPGIAAWSCLLFLALHTWRLFIAPPLVHDRAMHLPPAPHPRDASPPGN